MYSSQLISRFFDRTIIFRIFSLLVIFLSATLIFFSDWARPFFVDFLNFDLGARAEYIDNSGAHSLSKTTFVLLVIFVCYQFVRDVSQAFYSRIFTVFMVFMLALFYVLSGIVAVRFSFFILCVLLPLRGVLLFEFERFLFWRIALLLFSPFIFYMSTIYTFSNSV